jgi:multimeric flavodoxin WrbA
VSALFPEELNTIWKNADGVVIGAPVYWGSINGLTKDFMDSLKILDVNGRYGLGISIAGGTGRGLCSGVQMIYRFFYHRRIRGIEPMLVSRFNFEKTLKSIPTVGKRLGELSKEKKPFEGDKDRMEHYEKLDYLNYTYLDEMLLLAKQLIEISKDNPKLQKAKEEYDKAESHINHGNRIAAIEHAVGAYNMLFFDPPKK